MVNPEFSRIAPDVKLGEGVKIYAFVNLYGCEIGAGTKNGTFVEIQKGARIGKQVKVSIHTFICEGVTTEDEVFIGHGVMFINDKYPRSTTAGGQLQTEEDSVCTPTWIKRGASIGSNATILCGVTLGEDALVGAGSGLHMMFRQGPLWLATLRDPLRSNSKVRRYEYPIHRLKHSVRICVLKLIRRFKLFWIEPISSLDRM